MFLVELIASSFLDGVSKQARPECRCKRVLGIHNYANVWTINRSKSLPGFRVVTSVDGTNGWSIETLLRRENDSN